MTEKERRQLLVAIEAHEESIALLRARLSNNAAPQDEWQIAFTRRSIESLQTSVTHLVGLLSYLRAVDKLGENHQ